MSNHQKLKEIMSKDSDLREKIRKCMSEGVNSISIIYSQAIAWEKTIHNVDKTNYYILLHTLLDIIVERVASEASDHSEYIGILRENRSVLSLCRIKSDISWTKGNQKFEVINGLYQFNNEYVAIDEFDGLFQQKNHERTFIIGCMTIKRPNGSIITITRDGLHWRNVATTDRIIVTQDVINLLTISFKEHISEL